MGVLKASLLALLAGCYSPSVRDCSVTCARASDCAEHQVCGDDHFCASPERAGTCSQGGGPTSSAIDAPLAVMPDAAPPDARSPDAAPDASSDAALHVMVSGGGTVVYANIAVCRNDCTWIAPLGTSVELQAFPDKDKQLSSWMGPCSGNAETCAFVLVSSVTVSAKFVKASD